MILFDASKRHESSACSLRVAALPFVLFGVVSVVVVGVVTNVIVVVAAEVAMAAADCRRYSLVWSLLSSCSLEQTLEFLRFLELSVDHSTQCLASST